MLRSELLYECVVGLEPTTVPFDKGALYPSELHVHTKPSLSKRLYEDGFSLSRPCASSKLLPFLRYFPYISLLVTPLPPQ